VDKRRGARRGDATGVGFGVGGGAGVCHQVDHKHWGSELHRVEGVSEGLRVTLSRP
jgi:hypothetical protein